MTDLELINNAKAGCAESIRTLMDTHSGIFCRTIRRYSDALYGICQLSFQDLNDEKSILFWKAIDSFDSSKNVKFNTWLEKIVRYYCLNQINLYKRKISGQSVIIQHCQLPENYSEMHEYEGNTLSYEDNPTDRIDFKYLNNKKEEYLKKCDLKVAKVFEMVYSSSKPSWKKIGEEVGMSGWGTKLFFDRHFNELKNQLKEELI